MYAVVRSHKKVSTAQMKTVANYLKKFDWKRRQLGYFIRQCAESLFALSVKIRKNVLINFNSLSLLMSLHNCGIL
jgi:hypothetical protein